MTFSRRLKYIFDRFGNPLAHFANLLAALSFIGSAAAWFATNQHWLWPLAAGGAFCACLIMAVLLRQTRNDLAEVNQAFDSLLRREGYRIAADWQTFADSGPARVPITELVSAIEAMRPYIAHKKIEHLLHQVAQIERWQREQI